MSPEPIRDESIPDEPIHAAGPPVAGGGDPVCWADLVCAECGRIDGHRPECSQAPKADPSDR